MKQTISHILKIKSQGIHLACMLLALMVALGIAACSDDADEPTLNNLVGDWSGTSVYHNPVSGMKYRYLNISFEANGTGDFQYEAPTSLTVGYFTYSVKNNEVRCTGARAYSDGDVDEDFSMTLRIEGDRLIPLDKYDNFILTRDGSVTTDSNGNELIDHSEDIEGVWLNQGEVLVLEYGRYTLYQVASDTGYSSKSSGEYTYDYISKRFVLGITTYDVVFVNEKSMRLKNAATGNIIDLKRGSQSDVPQEANIAEMIINHHWCSKDNKYTFGFFSNGNATHYIEQSDIRVGSWGKAVLSAKGTFSMDGNKVICRYTDIYWEGGKYSDYKNIFPGWTYEGTRTKTYYVSEYYDEGVKLVDADGGKEIVLYQYI